MNTNNPLEVFTNLYNNSLSLTDLYNQLKNQSDILKYLYIKSIKLEDVELFNQLVEVSSTIDNKQVFRDILTMYGTDDFSLRYNHNIEQGLPSLKQFCDIIKSTKGT